MLHNSIPVKVKHKDGSISRYSVLARNILHKTKVEHVPLRDKFINSGTIKPAKT